MFETLLIWEQDLEICENADWEAISIIEDSIFLEDTSLDGILGLVLLRLSGVFF